MKLKDIDIGNLHILQRAVNEEVIRRKCDFEAREEEEREHLEKVLEVEGVI